MRKARSWRVPPWIATVLQAYVIVGGIVSLVGWAADLPRLTDWNGTGVSIQPNTTLAVIASGLALACLARGRARAGGALGLVVAAVGGITLLEWVAGLDLRIDTLLMFDRTWGRVGVIHPGRMGPAGATSWTLIGTALVLVASARRPELRRFVAPIASVTALISALGIVGHSFGSSPLYTLPTLTVIALQTATFVFTASLGLMLLVPERGLVRLLAEDGPGGFLARRALPPIVLVPIVLGYLRLRGEEIGLYDSPFGTSFRTVVEIVLLAGFLGWTAVALDRQERRRAEVDLELERSREQLEADLSDTRSLQQLSTRLIAEGEPARLDEGILETAAGIMRSDFASMQAFHPDRGRGGELQLLAHRGFSPEDAERWAWVDSDSPCICGLALRERRRVVVSDVETSPRFPEGARAAYRDAGIRAMQSTPLVSRSGEILGMVSTHWRAPREPSERELRLLDLLARQAADLLERRRADELREELLASERSARADAERAGRLKDEFLATLSHELRTPLNAVIGWCQILKKDVEDPEKSRVAVEVIERNGKLQAQLITDLLDVSRIISGKMRLDLQPLRLAAVVEAAVESMTPAAQAKGVRLERAIEPLAEPVSGDPARLQQVVWNLVSNAVKFTPKGGRVEVGLARVDGHAEIRVSDTGEGIAPEFLPHLFERFRQADASPARSHGGLGIGLAIVKQFVELHGGKVFAASPGKGRGSTFVIELPIAGAAGNGHAGGRNGSRPAAQALAGVRVLLVDDEPDALAMIRRTLEEHEAVVQTAISSSAALQELERAPVDVIVSDIGMPSGDGYELIAEVRRRGIRSPAVALTAFARSEDRARAMRSGYQAHVAKPVEAGELLSTVADLAARGADA